MMAGPDGNALAIEQLGHVVCMDSVENKTYNPAL